MTGMRKAALAAITLLVAAASLTSFAESYRALYDWASRHGLHGLWATVWPLQIDVFIAVGELALFVGLADRWKRRDRGAAWTVALIGLAVSVAGNVGHIATHDWPARATAAIPPLAAAAALTVGLGVLKRVVGSGAVQATNDLTSMIADLAGETAAALQALAAEVRKPLVVHVPAPAPANVRDRSAKPRTGAPARRTPTRKPGSRTRTAPVSIDDAEREFMSELAAGEVPSIRQVRARLHVGQDRAKVLRQHIARQALTT